MIPVVYNYRNLVVRKTTTIATGIGLALVVFVFASSCMLSEGIEKTLGRTAAPDMAVILRKGADAELSSGISDNQVSLIAAAPGIAKDGEGKPLMTGELVMIMILEKIGTDGGLSNVQFRGVPDHVMSIRKGVKIIAGRPNNPGTDEVIIGKSLRGRFKGLELGQTFEIRKNRPATVVGVFEDGGSSFESEIWGDVKNTGTAFGREGFVSSIRVKLESPTKFDGLKTTLESDPQLEVQVMRESEYYQKQSEDTALFVRILGGGIAILFSLGAMIGATITMHAAVANRQREVATLRALGFSKFSILLSFLLESVLLALGGGLVGVLASLGMQFVKFSTLNFASFSEMTFQFEPTPKIIVTSLVVAVVMGVLGGFTPARRAANMNLVQAIRGG